MAAELNTFELAEPEREDTACSLSAKPAYADFVADITTAPRRKLVTQQRLFHEFALVEFLIYLKPLYLECRHISNPNKIREDGKGVY